VARTACLAGDYGKGATILSQLFVETEDPNYIFNQGRCFEQNARYQEAISRFEEYLRVSKKVSDEDRAETQRHISDCQRLFARQSGQPTTAAPVVQATPTAPASTVSQVPVPPTTSIAPLPVIGEQSLQANSSPTSVPGSGLRTAGIVTASIGGVALVTGLILNLKVNSMASDFQTLDGYTESKESQRNTYKTLGWVGYGLGAACVATGAALYYLGARTGNSGSPSVAVLPAFAPGGGSAVVKGAF
jgi:hypothetical protein